MNQRTIVNATLHTSYKALPVPGLYWSLAHLLLTLSYNVRIHSVVLPIENHEIF